MAFGKKKIEEPVIGQNQQAFQENPPKKKHKKGPIIAIVIVAVIIIAAIAGGGSETQPTQSSGDQAATASTDTSTTDQQQVTAGTTQPDSTADTKAEGPVAEPEPKKTPEQIAQEKEEYKAVCAAVPYNTLARDPDSNMQKNIKFYGQVIQVLDDGNGGVTLRVSTKNSGYGYYDDVMLVVYTYSDGELKILEKDMVSVFGLSGGLYTYDTAMGSKMTVPIVYATYVDVES